MSGTRYSGALTAVQNDQVPGDPQPGFFSVQQVTNPTGLPAGDYQVAMVTAQIATPTNTMQYAMDTSGSLWTRRSVDLASTWSAWQTASNVPPFVPTVWRIADEKASGTGGGNAANGVNVRTLNTIASAGPSGASATLAANQITLRPGRYSVFAEAPGVANLLGGLRHIIYLFDVTNAATAIRGCTAGSLALLNIQTVSILSGFVEPVAPTVYELRHFFTSALVGGLGLPVGQGGANQEVYASVAITRLA